MEGKINPRLLTLQMGKICIQGQKRLYRERGAIDTGKYGADQERC